MSAEYLMPKAVAVSTQPKDPAGPQCFNQVRAYRSSPGYVTLQLRGLARYATVMLTLQEAADLAAALEGFSQAGTRTPWSAP